MQPWVHDVADKIDTLSFESTITTASGCSGFVTSAWAVTATLQFSSTMRRTASSDPCWEAICRVRSKGGGVTLNFGDLRLIRRLGSGDTGSVYLVELKGADGCVFAAKMMDKKELDRRDKESRARTEREVLELLDHPFLPTLYATMDSPRWSCLLTDFCHGGDIHALLERQPEKRFHGAAVRFYASELVVALEYLHMKGIVYRDLKPENVLIRSDGHIMLIDFDLSMSSTPMAHVVSDKNKTNAHSSRDYSIHPLTSNSSCMLPDCMAPAISCIHPKHKRRLKRTTRVGSLKIVMEPINARSMSFVGTCEYLAPEIVLGEEHGNAVDWWTLGIFIFELFYGVTPFKGTDHQRTLANIVARGFEFPKYPPLARPAKDMISQLLIKDPGKRMGYTMGATAMKDHPFFDGVNWALLRCIKPPFLPRPVAYKNLVQEDDCPETLMEYY